MATKRVRKPTDGDTWSIIVIDPETGQIGIAGASCTRDCSEMMAAALEAQRKQQAVEEILMQALEAGALEGGDTRCGEQKARSAFIMVAGPDDLPGQPTLYLKVTGQKEGGKNAVSMLRLKYDRGRSKSYRDSGL